MIRGCGERGPLLRSCWDCKLIHPLQRTVWRFLKKLKVELPFVCAYLLQSCLTLCHPIDCSLPGSSTCGIFQARILEWVAISPRKGSCQPRDWTWVSSIADRLTAPRLFHRRDSRRGDNSEGYKLFSVAQQRLKQTSGWSGIGVVDSFVLTILDAPSCFFPGNKCPPPPSIQSYSPTGSRISTLYFQAIKNNFLCTF